MLIRIEKAYYCICGNSTIFKIKLWVEILFEIFYNYLYRRMDVHMKKRSIFVILAVITLLIITGCTYEEKEKVSDAVKFKEEYESLNGEKVDGSDDVYREIEIPEDNPFVYADANDIITMMDNNETFVIYFGFAKCPWCRSVLPTLIDVSEELDLEKIYYVDVSEIRDKLDIDEDGKVITVKEGSEGYLGLLNRLDKVLEDYTLIYEDEEITTGEKRIYAPNVVSVVNGQAKELETGISGEQTDAYMELTDDMKKDTYNKFKCSIKCVLENKNSCSSKNAC